MTDKSESKSLGVNQEDAGLMSGLSTTSSKAQAISADTPLGRLLNNFEQDAGDMARLRFASRKGEQWIEGSTGGIPESVPVESTLASTEKRAILSRQALVLFHEQQIERAKEEARAQVYAEWKELGT